MKFISFQYQGRIAAGLWLENEVLDLAKAAALSGAAGDFSSLLAIIRGGQAAVSSAASLLKQRDTLRAATLAADAVQLRAPIPVPVRNIFCVGRNYVDHIKEGAGARGQQVELPKAPQFFTKATHTILAPDGDVRLDEQVTRKLDYEVELAVIIGTSGRDISKERALEHVFGYTIANDVTARDLQKLHDQWFKGKSLDTTLPLGPWIIDREAMGDPTTLQLDMKVNGEPRQQALVSQMIFDLPTIISTLSAGMTLDAGDIIATGTPSGVGFAMSPPCYLKAGDVMEARIDRIGTLRNRIVAA